MHEKCGAQYQKEYADTHYIMIETATKLLNGNDRETVMYSSWKRVSVEEIALGSISKKEAVMWTLGTATNDWTIPSVGKTFT